MPAEPQSHPVHYTEHSFWLVPAEPLRSQLQSIIRQLAKTYDAVDFEPHVTLSSVPSNDAQTFAIARQIAGHYRQVELNPLKLDHTSEYTKTLFIQFQDSAAARHLSDAIKARSMKPVNYILNPHLSLLYKILPQTVLAELEQTLEVPKGPYIFDRVCAIETEIPLSESQQIKRWRTVFECALGAL